MNKKLELLAYMFALIVDFVVTIDDDQAEKLVKFFENYFEKRNKEKKFKEFKEFIQSLSDEEKKELMKYLS
uniref:Uncharacterized protein n=1 Tax=Saccharolobus islandicus TaxID=43080 RepID=Q9HH87_SACIS|nr:hypothetical protein [Sulfolobus islandicus]CAC15846.1 hypothetical protein [Sulfolobus islandicus]